MTSLTDKERRDLESVDLKIGEFCYAQFDLGRGEWSQCIVRKRWWSRGIKRYLLEVLDPDSRKGRQMTRPARFRHVRRTFCKAIIPLTYVRRVVYV